MDPKTQLTLGEQTNSALFGSDGIDASGNIQPGEGSIAGNIAGSPGAAARTAGTTAAGVMAGDMYDKRVMPKVESRQTINNVDNNIDRAKQRFPALAERINASNPGSGGAGTKPIQSGTFTAPGTGGRVTGKANLAGGMRNRPMTFNQHTPTTTAGAASSPGAFQPNSAQQSALRSFNKTMPWRTRFRQGMGRHKGKAMGGAAGLVGNALLGKYMQGMEE
jgi:hypothetical protein